jgi:hypothetical protein
LDGLPVKAVNVAVGYDLQFLLSGEVITDVAVLDRAGAEVLRVFDTNEDSDCATAASAKYLAPLLA